MLFVGSEEPDMIRTSLVPLLCVAVLAGAVLPVSAQVEVPVLKFTGRTLDNGLKVYSIEDHSNPTVAIQVWYHVGSKDDPEGRSGFAHLFEHMMFKSTKNMPDEMMDRLTEDVGGANNAFTADDVTVYHEIVPANYLETLLWAEADRLASLTVDEKNFISERDVVKEEYRQSYVVPPYGKLYLSIEPYSYSVHPYRRPGIGNIEELDAAALEEVRAFHATYYRPDNATLIVAGDFDPAQLDAWVDRYFGRIPRPADPLPRVELREPERTAERRHVVHGPNVPLPAIVLTYQVPPAVSDEADPLRLLDAILSTGRSSRLYRSLVYEKQLAQSVDTWLSLREDTGFFAVILTLASGKTLAEAEAPLLGELERLRTEPAGAAELEKAKNKLLTSILRQRETNEGRAMTLGDAAVLLGEPERVNTEVERLAKVTAEDVQRAARAFLTDSNRVVIHYLQEPAAQPAEAAAPQQGP
jgi:zinc protease